MRGSAWQTFVKRWQTFLKRRFDPAQRFGLRLTLWGFALVLVGVPFGLLLDQVVRSGPLVKIDTAAANHLHGWVRQSSASVTVLQFISFLGKPVFFFAIGIPAAIYLVRRHRLRLVAFLGATTIGGGFVDTIVKVVVDRDRPSLVDPVATAHGQSFPSGHAMQAVIMYGALLLIFMPVVTRRMRPWLIGAAVALCLAIGFSRLALGVHYISDVLGGYVLGLAWLIASTATFSIWRQERGRRPVEPMRGLEPEAKKDLTVHPG